MCSKLNDYEVLDIGTGYESSYFLIAGNKIFACGNNKYGCKHTDIEYLPNDPYNGTYNFNSKVYYNPVDLIKFRGKKIIKMFCNRYHSMFLSSDGRLYTFGWDAAGQLGLGASENKIVDSKIVRTLHEVSFFNNKNIKDVALGNTHTLVLTTDGNVYSFGFNGNGELGRGYKDENFNGTPKLSVRGVSHINASNNRSIFITTNKNVIYSVGRNDYGGLGIGNNESESSLQKIDFFDKNKINITKIASGYYHSLFLSEDGDVYAVGANNQGQVGYGAKDMFGTVYIKKVTASGIIKDIFAGSDRSYCIS